MIISDSRTYWKTRHIVEMTSTNKMPGLRHKFQLKHLIAKIPHFKLSLIKNPIKIRTKISKTSESFANYTKNERAARKTK